MQLEQQFIRPTFTFSNFGSVVFDYDVDVGGDAAAIRYPRCGAARRAIADPPPLAAAKVRQGTRTSQCSAEEDPGSKPATFTFP